MTEAAQNSAGVIQFIANFEMLLKRIKPISKPSELDLIRVFVDGIGEEIAERALRAMRLHDELAGTDTPKLLDVDGDPVSWKSYKTVIYSDNLYKKRAIGSTTSTTVDGIESVRREVKVLRAELMAEINSKPKQSRSYETNHQRSTQQTCLICDSVECRGKYEKSACQFFDDLLGTGKVKLMQNRFFDDDNRPRVDFNRGRGGLKALFLKEKQKKSVGFHYDNK